MIMSSERKPFTVRKLAIAAILVYATLYLLSMFVNYKITDGGLRECRYDMELLGRSVASYYGETGVFPLQVINDRDGKPIHSWRGVIHSANMRRLQNHPEWEHIKAYLLDEPWNGSHNSEFIRNCPPIFRCWSDPGRSGDASYFCVSGDNTPFSSKSRDGKTVDFQQISKRIMEEDGKSNTILFLEKHKSNIVWSEPRDLPIDEIAKSGISNPLSSFAAHPSSLGTRHGSMAYFADESVQFLNSNIDPKILRSLLEVDNPDKPKETFVSP